MLADVRHHRPGDWLVGTLGRLLDEADMAPVGVVELPGVVVTVPELERVVGQAIPFLARDLAGLAPDAERRVREESDRLCHGISSPSGWV